MVMNILVRELRIDTPFFGAAKKGRIVVQAQRHLADSFCIERGMEM